MDSTIAAMPGVGWMEKNTGGRTQPTRTEIAELAYQLWEVDGRHEGNDVTNWLVAERQLVNHYASR